MLLSLGWSEARQLQYGLASVDDFCKGSGELDQLGDVASELMMAKYPRMGPLRVSNIEKVASNVMAMFKMLNVDTVISVNYFKVRIIFIRHKCGTPMPSVGQLPLCLYLLLALLNESKFQKLSIGWFEEPVNLNRSKGSPLCQLALPLPAQLQPLL